MEVLVHPNLTMRKYHEGDDEPPYAWTAACVRDALARRFPDLRIVLPAAGALPEDLGGTKVLLAGRVDAALLERMPKLA